MNRKQFMGCVGLWLACGSDGRAAGDDALFRDLTLEKAQQAATEGKKRLVLVDFYTTWCGPCKKLDETTWKDAKVRDWLGREAVCLKVDAEKDESLAAKYRVNAYPTILLLKPDGTELDRLVGYRDASAFLNDAGEALAGNDSLSRARKSLEGAKALDPMLRMNYGDALARKGRPEDALSEFLWCYDHGLEHGPGFVGVRLSFLLGRIVQLGQAHPAALDELRKRRDEAAGLLEAARGGFAKAMDFTSLNTSLGEPARTMVLYDKIKGDRAQPENVVQYLFSQALDQLLAAKRYKEVVEGSDSKAVVRELISRHDQMKAMMPDDAGLRDFMKKQVSLDGSKYYEALLGSGDPGGAAEVASLLETFDPEGSTRPLIAAARRAGDPKAADALAAKARDRPKVTPKP